MNSSNKKLGALAGAMALVVGLGVVATQSTGCEDAAKACGLACPTDEDKNEIGVAEGQASISGFAPIDAFFKSVINYRTVAAQVSLDIRNEINGIALAVGVDPARVAAGTDLGAAVVAKLKADFNASLKVVAQPPRCEIDAKVTAEVSAQCKANAGCEVTPGSASVECKGSCEVELPSAEAKCEAGAELYCEFSGPSIACDGQCKGTCTVDVSAACEGSCEGSCMGTWEGGTMGGSGSGKCNGTCMGKCSVSGGASCKGTCNGSCQAKAPTGGCEATAHAYCEVMATGGSVQCQGRCDGEFTPPQVDCEANASCDASAKADAQFNATCTPPRLEIAFVVQGNLNGQAQARWEFIQGELRTRLPRLLAALKRADLAATAAANLAGNGRTAIEGAVSAFGDGSADIVAAWRIGKCVPNQLAKVPDLIGKSTTELKAQFCTGVKLSNGLGASTTGLGSTMGC